MYQGSQQLSLAIDANSKRSRTILDGLVAFPPFLVFAAWLCPDADSFYGQRAFSMGAVGCLVQAYEGR